MPRKNKHNNKRATQSILTRFIQNKIATFIVLALTSGFTNVQAEGLQQNDMNLMAYITIPFGSIKSSKYDDSMKLGFTIEQTIGYQEITNTNFYNYQPHKLSLLDIQYSSQTNYFSRFNVGGADVLTYEYVMNADGTTTKWPMGLSASQMLLTGLVAGAIGYGIYQAVDDDDDDEENTPSGPGGGGSVL